MSGAQGADGAAAAGDQNQEVDDGFTAEERAQFGAMAEATPPPAPGAQTPPAETPAATEPQIDPVTGQPVVQPAAAEADDDDDGDEAPGQQANGQQRQPRRVSYNKFQRVADQLAATEKERNELKEKYARVDERLNLLNEALTAPQQRQEAKAEEADPEPDPEKDIFGWVQWSRRKTARLEEMLTSQQTESKATRDEAEVAMTYTTAATAFVQKEPNFVPAYRFLIAGRTAELALYHFGKDVFDDQGNYIQGSLTPAEEKRIRADISAEERELVENALKANKDPAAAVYGMAKARGFRPQARAAAPAAGADAAGGGKAPAAGKPPGGLGEAATGGAGAAPKVAEEIDRIQRGAAAATSLSQGGGAPAATTLTPDRLANMNDEDFGALLENLPQAKLKELLGN